MPMLCWNVYREDFNSHDINLYNIFNHYGFYRDCVAARKKYKDDKEKFGEEVRNALLYFFWAKCEHEVVITSLIDGEIGQLRTDTTAGTVRGLLQPSANLGYIDEFLPVTVKCYRRSSSFDGLKIDVYSQVMANWEPFLDYLWENRKELKSHERK